MPCPRPLYSSGITALLVALAACGPGTTPVAAALDDRCGEPEPVQLLSLSPDELVPFARDAYVEHGDRRLVAINTLSEDHDPAHAYVGPPVASRVVSVDACGQGEPQLVAEGADRIFPPPREGLPWLVCSDTTERMFMIFPDGDRGPTDLGTVPWCRVQESSHGLWIQRQFDGQEQILGIRPALGQLGVYVVSNVTSHAVPGYYSLAAAGEYLWYVDDERRLVQLGVDSPTDNGHLSDDAAAVVVAANERFLAWGTESEALTPGRWTIYDRDTGQQAVVDIAGQTDVRLRLARFSFVFEARIDDETSRYALVRLPSLETTVFEGKQWGNMIDTGSGDLVLQSQYPEEDLYRLTSGSTEPERIYEGTVVTFRVDDDEILAWDYYDYDPAVGPVQGAATQLVRLPLDGLQPEIVIDEVFQPLGFDDDRWLQVRGFAGDGRGELRILDPSGGPEAIIDRDVEVWFARRNAYANPTAGTDILPSDASFVYSVHGGERRGLWTAALAPAP